MSASATPKTTTQIHEIYIKAKPQKIWDAITKPEWNAKYGYGAFGGPQFYDLSPGGSFRVPTPPMMQQMGLPDPMIDGEVLEVDPPRKLVQTYRLLFSPEMKAEGFTRLTWEIEETQSGFCRLTVTHELEGAPIVAGTVASKFSETGTGGWGWILSDMKSFIETGKPMAG